jgi:hypothetical protein
MTEMPLGTKGDMMIIALAGFAIGIIRSLATRSGVIGILINLTIFSVYAAGYLKTVFLLRIFLAVVMVLLGITAVFMDRTSSNRRRNLAVVFTIAVIVISTTVLTGPKDTTGELDKLFRYLIVLPAAFAVGAQLRAPIVVRIWMLSYRFWTLLFAVAAIAEYARGKLFFPRDGFAVSLGSLSFRSFVMSEHSLVLATMLLAGVPYLLGIKARLPKVLALALVGAGIWTTGSDGPVGLFWMAIAAYAITRVAKLNVIRWAKILAISVATLFAALALLGTVLNYAQQVIVTSATDAASSQYRVVLYAAIWPNLLERPFGFGIPGIPDGVLLAPTPHRLLDLARTIDSEFVFLTLEFGWIGLVAGLAAIFLVFRARVLSTAIGQSVILITAAGFFLALHAWLGLGLLWLLQLGMAYAVRKHPEPEPPPQSFRSSRDESDPNPGISELQTESATLRSTETPPQRVP